MFDLLFNPASCVLGRWCGQVQASIPLMIDCLRAGWTSVSPSRLLSHPDPVPDPEDRAAGALQERYVSGGCSGQVPTAVDTCSLAAPFQHVGWSCV